MVNSSLKMSEKVIYICHFFFFSQIISDLKNVAVNVATNNQV